MQWSCSFLVADIRICRKQPCDPNWSAYKLSAKLVRKTKVEILFRTKAKHVNMFLGLWLSQEKSFSAQALTANRGKRMGWFIHDRFKSLNPAKKQHQTRLQSFFGDKDMLMERGREGALKRNCPDLLKKEREGKPPLPRPSIRELGNLNWGWA